MVQLRRRLPNEKPRNAAAQSVRPTKKGKQERRVIQSWTTPRKKRSPLNHRVGGSFICFRLSLGCLFPFSCRGTAFPPSSVPAHPAAVRRDSSGGSTPRHAVRRHGHAVPNARSGACKPTEAARIHRHLFGNPTKHITSQYNSLSPSISVSKAHIRRKHAQSERAGPRTFSKTTAHYPPKHVKESGGRLKGTAKTAATGDMRKVGRRAGGGAYARRVGAHSWYSLRTVRKKHKKGMQIKAAAHTYNKPQNNTESGNAKRMHSLPDPGC